MARSPEQGLMSWGQDFGHSIVTFVTFVNPPTSKTKDICLDGRNIVITFQSIPTFPPKDDLQISAPDPMIELHVAETPQRSSLLASY